MKGNDAVRNDFFKENEMQDALADMFWTYLLQAFLIFGSAAFILAFPLPFFARRFDKFLPADPGTALVRSFHIPRFAKSPNEERRKQRNQYWKKLISAGIKWGLLGVVTICGIIYFSLPLALFVFLWLCALLACIDEKIHVLPDVLTIPLILSGFLFASLSWLEISPLASACGAAAGFLLPTLTSALMTPIRPRSMGGGDFKMLAGIGAWLGFAGLAVTILLSFFFFAAIALFKHKKEGPYGASLLLAVIATLILQTLPAFRFLFIVV